MASPAWLTQGQRRTCDRLANSRSRLPGISSEPEVGRRLHPHWIAEGWLYVASVADLFSRRVVGWAIKTEMTVQLATDPPVTTIRRRGNLDRLLHHSYRSSQYKLGAVPAAMADYGITCSMTRAGNM